MIPAIIFPMEAILSSGKEFPDLNRDKAALYVTSFLREIEDNIQKICLIKSFKLHKPLEFSSDSED